LGFDEVSNYSFITAEMMEKCGFDPEKCLHVLNPITQDANLMRTTLVPHIVSNIATNQKRFKSFNLFEIGRATQPDARHNPELAEENRRIAGAICRESDLLFYELKGLVIEALEYLGLPDVTLSLPEETPAWAHPGRVADVKSGDTIVGSLGELHPKVSDEFELKNRCGLFDLDLDVIFELNKPLQLFTSLRRFPVNPIEITVVVSKRTMVSEIEAVIRESGGEMLVACEYLYLYEGKPLADDVKAVTYHVVFGADRTLTGEEVASLHETLVSDLNKAGMPLRGEE